MLKNRVGNGVILGELGGIEKRKKKKEKRGFILVCFRGLFKNVECSVGGGCRFSGVERCLVYF